MRLVDDEERDAAADLRQHFKSELFVGQAFGGDEQDIDLVVADGFGDFFPLVGIVRVDRLCPKAHALSRRDLVAHQRQKGRDQQCRAVAGFPQKVGRYEVNKALAPTRLLDDQEASTSFDDATDGFFLTITERCIGKARPEAQQLQGSIGLVAHFSTMHMSGAISVFCMPMLPTP